MSSRFSRREWLASAAGLFAAVAPTVAGAKRRKKAKMPKGQDWFPVPFFSAAGDSYRELGFKIGNHFRERIQKSHRDRREWVDKLAAFVSADPKTRRDPFLNALREEMPRLVEEMEGLAQGSGISFDRLFTVALNPELSAMMRQKSSDKECTTVAVASGDQLWIGHNEDGSCAYADDMYLLDITWPTGLRSWCFCYPGYLPGNGPSVNSAGMAQTVNFIGAKSWQPGIPRYAIDRAVMEAETLDQALSIATHPRRAYSQHHVLLSTSENKIIGVETSADRSAVHEVSGLYVHANHYVLPEMKAVPEFDLYQGTSQPRQQIAEEWANSVSDPAKLTPEDLHSILSSHQNYPLSICRHPEPKFTGCTLGSTLLLAREKTLRFYAHQPCQRVFQDIPWPEA